MNAVDRIIKNGRSVAPQVQQLMEKFCDRTIGDSITYGEMAQTIGERLDSNRFRTVLRAFQRALFKDRNVAVENLRNVGIKILSPVERTFAGVKMFGGAVKKLIKTDRYLEVVPTEDLTDAQRHSHMHVRNRAHMTATHARAELSATRVELTQPKQNPRISAVR